MLLVVPTSIRSRLVLGADCRQMTQCLEGDLSSSFLFSVGKKTHCWMLAKEVRRKTNLSKSPLPPCMEFTHCGKWTQTCGGWAPKKKASFAFQSTTFRSVWRGNNHRWFCGFSWSDRILHLLYVKINGIRTASKNILSLNILWKVTWIFLKRPSASWPSSKNPLRSRFNFNLTMTWEFSSSKLLPSWVKIRISWCISKLDCRLGGTSINHLGLWPSYWWEKGLLYSRSIAEHRSIGNCSYMEKSTEIWIAYHQPGARERSLNGFTIGSDHDKWITSENRQIFLNSWNLSKQQDTMIHGFLECPSFE